MLMTHPPSLPLVLVAASCLLAGCGRNEPPAPAAKPERVSAPASSGPAVAPAPAPPSSPPTTSPALAKVEAAPATQPAEPSTSGTSTQTNGVLASLRTDFEKTRTALSESLGSSQGLKDALDKSTKALDSGQAAEAVGLLHQLSETKLTADQTQLAKELKNVGSAYLVQKNLGSLEGQQGNVAQIVSSLRQGQVLTAWPAIQKVATNTKLTSSQKDFVGALADKYAPGLKKVGDTLGSAVKSLNTLRNASGGQEEAGKK